MRTVSNTLIELSRRPFVRNVLAVVTGTATAQAITIAFAPVITRLYGPESFGQLGAFMALLNVLAPIAALTYPIAIVLPKKDEDALAIAKLSVLLALSVTVLVALALFFSAEQLAGSLGLQAIADFLMLIPVAMFFAACMQLLARYFPGRLNGHAQGIFYGFSSGIGGVLGALVAGGLWSFDDGRLAFLVAGAAAAAAAGIAWVALRPRMPSPRSEAPRV